MPSGMEWSPFIARHSIASGLRQCMHAARGEELLARPVLTAEPPRKLPRRVPRALQQFSSTVDHIPVHEHCLLYSYRHGL